MVQIGWNQALLGVAQCRDKRQGAQTGMEEVPSLMNANYRLSCNALFAVLNLIQFHKKKHIFTARVTKYCHRLPIVVGESPSLELLKSHMDMVF